MNFLLVFFGGGIGCIVRYVIGLAFQRSGSSLPWATFFSNVTACLVFSGVIWYTTTKGIHSPGLRLLLLTGFCGGLSTFSTFGYETFLLLKESLYLYAFLNMMISCGLCVFIFYLFK